MEYEGVIVHNPPPVRTYSGQAVYGSKEWFELSRQDLDVLLPRCANVPLRTEHGRGVVGSVLHGFYNDEGHASVRFRFHDNDVGRNANELVRAGLMRGLSLCHKPATLDVSEVSVCFKGARPNTGISHQVVRASAAETKSGGYKLQGPDDWVTTFAACAPVQCAASGAMMSQVQHVAPQPAAPQGQPQPAAPQGQPQPQYAAPQAQPATFTITAEEQARLLQARQPQPQSSVLMIPAHMAAQYAEQVIRNTQGTPFQPPLSSGLGEPAQQAPPQLLQAQQQPPQPQAAEQPPSDAPESRKRKAEAAPESSDAPDSGVDIVEAIVKHQGAISNEMRTKLLDDASRKEQQLAQLEQKLAQMEQERQALSEDANHLRTHFTDTMLPFMRSVLGGDAITPKDEEAMKTAVRSKEALPFLAKWGGPLSRAVTAVVAASGQNLRPAGPQMSEELARKLQTYHALQNRVAPAPSAPASYAQPQALAPQWQTTAPMQLSAGDVSSNYGWAPVPGYVSAPAPMQLAQVAASASSSVAPKPAVLLPPVSSDTISLKEMFGGRVPTMM